MKINVTFVIITSLLSLSLIIICALFGPKETQLKDALGPNPLAPWGMRFIDKDIKRNAEKF